MLSTLRTISRHTEKCLLEQTLVAENSQMTVVNRSQNTVHPEDSQDDRLRGASMLAYCSQAVNTIGTGNQKLTIGKQANSDKPQNRLEFMETPVSMDHLCNGMINPDIPILAQMQTVRICMDGIERWAIIPKEVLYYV